MDSNAINNVIVGGGAFLALILLSQRWFWALALGLGMLASAFACIASVVHFQILAGVGFFVLALFLWLAFSTVTGD